MSLEVEARTVAFARTAFIEALQRAGVTVTATPHRPEPRLGRRHMINSKSRTTRDQGMAPIEDR